MKQQLIVSISSPPSAPLKTCWWWGDAIICFAAPPPEPYIMCGNKALQQQICICFLYLSSSSHQGWCKGNTLPVWCLESGKEDRAPPRPSWNWGKGLVFREERRHVPWKKRGLSVHGHFHHSLNHTLVLSGRCLSNSGFIDRCRGDLPTRQVRVNQCLGNF